MSKKFIYKINRVMGLMEKKSLVNEVGGSVVKLERKLCLQWRKQEREGE